MIIEGPKSSRILKKNTPPIVELRDCEIDPGANKVDKTKLMANKPIASENGWRVIWNFRLRI